jgi:hypothetical protein
MRAVWGLVMRKYGSPYVISDRTAQLSPIYLSDLSALSVIHQQVSYRCKQDALTTRYTERIGRNATSTSTSAITSYQTTQN